MKVGLLLPLSDDDGSGAPAWPFIRDLARQAEAGGIDSLWICDHLLFRLGGEATGIHEAWTVLTAVATATERVELGTIVLSPASATRRSSRRWPRPSTRSPAGA
jgi:alkanesulfonate monooxygenase SsuD/methylene tetrahydromethanopterin reductase-like flavin-dependent oxidoreductase (luciferase family)